MDYSVILFVEFDDLLCVSVGDGVIGGLSMAARGGV
jgi:hypothetical protein